MARPPKKGLDYYPQDVDAFSDRKIKRLLNEFGATGYLVYEYIKALCYKENGYWVRYDKNFCFDVADVLKSGITENSVREILKGCFRMSLFDRTVFDASLVITSAGIQKRFLEVRHKGIIDMKYKVICSETPENDDLSTQRKGKKSKEKESMIVEASSTEQQEFISKKRNEFRDMLKPYEQEFGLDMINAFYLYWSEPTRSQKKLLWELQKTWDTRLRLLRWQKNDDKMSKLKSFTNQQDQNTEGMSKVAQEILKAKVL